MNADNPNVDFISAAEQQIAKVVLAGSQFFSTETILTNAAGDLDARITEALASLALFLIIDVRGGKMPLVGASEPWTVWLTVSENPITNRGEGGSGKTCRMCVEELARLLDDTLGLGDANAEPVLNDDGLEIWRITAKINMTIRTLENTP